MDAKDVREFREYMGKHEAEAGEHKAELSLLAGIGLILIEILLTENAPLGNAVKALDKEDEDAKKKAEAEAKKAEIDAKKAELAAAQAEVEAKQKEIDEQKKAIGGKKGK